MSIAVSISSSSKGDQESIVIPCFKPRVDRRVEIRRIILPDPIKPATTNSPVTTRRFASKIRLVDCLRASRRYPTASGDTSRHPTRISRVNRITPDIAIHVHAIAVADGIGLHEAPEGGRVDARFVVIQAQLGEPRLAGISKPPEVGARRNAVFIISVLSDCGSARISHRNDRPALIGDQPGRSVSPAPSYQTSGVSAPGPLRIWKLSKLSP